MCTEELIKATFVRNIMSKYGQFEYPTLLMRWNRYLNFLNCQNTDTSKEFCQWRANTVAKHYTDHHKFRKISFAAHLNTQERKNMMAKGNGVKKCTEVMFCNYIAGEPEYRYAEMYKKEKV